MKYVVVGYNVNWFDASFHKFCKTFDSEEETIEFVHFLKNDVSCWGIFAYQTRCMVID